MRRRVIILFLIITILSLSIMIILQFGPSTNKNTYLHSISDTVLNREIIAANAYLLKYDYNDKKTTYKTILKDDEKFSSVIKLLIASKDLVLNTNMQDKIHYSVGIFYKH